MIAARFRPGAISESSSSHEAGDVPTRAVEPRDDAAGDGIAQVKSPASAILQGGVNQPSSGVQPAFGNLGRSKHLVGADISTHIGEWVHILPDDFPRWRHFEEASVRALADQSVPVRLALCAANKVAEKRPDGTAALLSVVLGHNGHSEHARRFGSYALT